MFKNLLKISAISLLIGITTPVLGQYHETIRSGRPGQSIGPFTVGSHVFQIQSGVDYSSSSNEVHTFLTNQVVRYGIAEKLEISTVFDLRTDQYRYEGIPDFSQAGFTNLQAGFRYNFIDQPNGLIPAVGLQVRTRVPLHSSDYKITRFAPVAILVTGHSLGNGWGLTTNWITAYDGNSTQPNYKYIVNLSFPIANKWSGFVENYGQLGSDFDTYFDGGLAYLVNPDFQLDLFGGLTENDGTFSHFLSMGISWRTKFE